MEQRVEMAPRIQLPTNRGLGKLILLSIVTFGIYSLFFYANISNEINLIASRHDGKKTMNYWLLFFVVGVITLGIALYGITDSATVLAPRLPAGALATHLAPVIFGFGTSLAVCLLSARLSTYTSSARQQI